MLNHLCRRHWWYYMQLDLILTHFWIVGTSLYGVKQSLNLTVSQQYTWGVNQSSNTSMKLEWPENRVSFLLDYVQQRGVKASSKQREFGKQLFLFAYRRDWPSVLKIISETTSWFEVGPWSCINRWCIIHELAKRLPSSSRLGCAKMCLLASPGWLALWEGIYSLQKAADIIRLIFTVT